MWVGGWGVGGRVLHEYTEATQVVVVGKSPKPILGLTSYRPGRCGEWGPFVVRQVNRTISHPTLILDPIHPYPPPIHPSPPSPSPYWYIASVTIQNHCMCKVYIYRLQLHWNHSDKVFRKTF